MKTIAFAFASVFLSITPTAYPQYAPSQSWNGQDTFLAPHHQNAFGPNINRDATGRPFQWETQQGFVPNEPLHVQPDAFGPGVGMDQYGRPVRAKKW